MVLGYGSLTIILFCANQISGQTETFFSTSALRQCGPCVSCINVDDPANNLDGSWYLESGQEYFGSCWDGGCKYRNAQGQEQCICLVEEGGQVEHDACEATPEPEMTIPARVTTPPSLMPPTTSKSTSIWPVTKDTVIWPPEDNTTNMALVPTIKEAQDKSTLMDKYQSTSTVSLIHTTESWDAPDKMDTTEISKGDSTKAYGKYTNNPTMKK